MTSSREEKVTTKARRCFALRTLRETGGRIGACEGLDPGSSADWEPTRQSEAVRTGKEDVWDVIQFERAVFRLLLASSVYALIEFFLL